MFGTEIGVSIIREKKEIIVQCIESYKSQTLILEQIIVKAYDHRFVNKIVRVMAHIETLS